MRRWGIALALTLVLSATACSEEPPQQASREWTKVELPAGEEPVLLTAQDDDLLIGLRHPGVRVKPRLMVRTPDGRTSPVPLQPKSPYAYEAKWYSIVTDGTKLLAVGGAPGGAHANTRWTVWTGTTQGLVEKPQSFNTFGGWGAGSLIDAIVTPSGDALTGTWGSDQAGLDIAVWLPKGDRWIRQMSTGTPLQSTRDLQLTPRSGIAVDASIVMAGSQLSLSDGVKQRAVLLRSGNLNEGWSRLELPDPGDRSEAASVSCTPNKCVVAGWVDGRLALWSVEGENAKRLDDVPRIAVGDKDVLPEPIQDGDRLIQVAGENGQVKVVDGNTVETADGPSGAVLDAVLIKDTLYVIAGGSLWRTGL